MNPSVDAFLEKTDKMNEYLNLALSAAAINSFSTVSKDDADALHYLELAHAELIDANLLVYNALDDQIKANTFITLKLE